MRRSRSRQPQAPRRRRRLLRGCRQRLEPPAGTGTRAAAASGRRRRRRRQPRRRQLCQVVAVNRAAVTATVAAATRWEAVRWRQLCRQGRHSMVAMESARTAVRARQTGRGSAARPSRGPPRLPRRRGKRPGQPLPIRWRCPRSASLQLPPPDSPSRPARPRCSCMRLRPQPGLSRCHSCLSPPLPISHRAERPGKGSCAL